MIKKEYMALQEAWNQCLGRYLAEPDNEIRSHIIDDWKDSLVDMNSSNPKENLRSIYEKWEQETWIPFCKKELSIWIKSNPFQAKVDKKKYEEYNNIKQDCNYQRFRMIMQVIQDSGIGLGHGYRIGETEVKKT